MICKQCKQDKPYFAKGLCKHCYDINYHNNKTGFIYKISKPLKKNDIEHNLKAIYSKLKYFRKKRDNNIIS